MRRSAVTMQAKMTDWKQITARIRRARTSKDPAGQLSNLYQKTRDAMVAFELAKFFETSGQNADAAKWYSAAAERFRRSDWKVKAQEAAVRLGGAPGEIPLEAGAPPNVEFALTPPPVPTPPRVTHSHAIPSLPIEPIGEPGAASVKGRYGDPGLSSRISLLEMQFRRLMTCPPAKLEDADRAPAGPGVFVLTDSDLTSYYYVEACQTLRIAIGNLLRGGSSRRGVDSIKPQLAQYLGIPETRVAKYLAEHCVVRWLQLDEGASNFADFVIAVLRPALNE